VHVDFNAAYFRKTDDELLALAADSRSLEPKAQSVLLDELRRRKIVHAQLLHKSEPPEVLVVGNNPAFNVPARIAALITALGLLGFLLSMIVAAVQVHQFWIFVLVFALIWGSIFALIAWGTHLVLRNRGARALKNHELK